MGLWGWGVERCGGRVLVGERVVLFWMGADVLAASKCAAVPGHSIQAAQYAPIQC
jgi:hypothetical protein